LKDPVIKPHFLEKFASGFPCSQKIKLETCGHFPQEEQSVLVANEIFQFLAEI